MIKDPLFNEETPYDILGVPPHANHNEVHQALPRFMRDKKNVARIGKAQDAVKKLGIQMSEASLTSFTIQFQK